MPTATPTLSQAIDRVNDASFWGEKLSATERESLAKQIVATHGRPGAYANTFALSGKERSQGIMLFTGEKTLSAAARHISGEEACRALRLLDVKDRDVATALDEASASLLECLRRSERDKDHRMGGNPGMFCCGRCTVSVWRHILAGGFDRKAERLRAGVQRLKDFRDTKGRWQYFPFWYTVSALAEMDGSVARDEIRYVAKLLERPSKRPTARNQYDNRRQEVARRALEKA